MDDDRRGRMLRQPALIVLFLYIWGRLHPPFLRRLWPHADYQRIEQLEIDLGYWEPGDSLSPPPPRIKAPPRKRPLPAPDPLPTQTEEPWLTEISGKPWWESEAYKEQQRRKKRDG